MQGYKILVNALEERFDFMSARVIARDAIKRAGLTDQTEWSDDEMRRAVANLPNGVRDFAPIVAKLGLA